MGERLPDLVAPVLRGAAKVDDWHITGALPPMPPVFEALVGTAAAAAPAAGGVIAAWPAAQQRAFAAIACEALFTGTLREAVRTTAE